ncbi:MAG: HNH endonuclease [Phenylobacterium sp.]|uniref:HNH endonuclease n=1 Tax=Phenylobacterium sp. TaxID=1871053 RepID=UPI0025F6BA84|nr:HNH endonuclease [Phenylobacterium sp.]MCA6223812.1 HNH endonuclease [Phenylobacterium sp.]MCA6227306.1 HNH endonuclease [Phenylobacterium sp.]MCA6230907.1 HNH endonuclease [Phenylobacterium sp.]MCA6234625.1 HNH endonuclease [Phenylobacterium sp.]MCA6250530.1 HNH endonuclease [Phenylobacterium sp.]
MKAIFDVRPKSEYDDDITERYHFPSSPSEYVEAAMNALDDWVIFREPRRSGGRTAYIAAAKVVSVKQDPLRSDHLYAYVSDFIPFPNPVPIYENGRYFEKSLRDLVDRRSAGRTIQGKSLRTISDADFNEIVAAGLKETLSPDNARRVGLEGEPELLLPAYSLQETDNSRATEQLLLNRKVRDANFRLQVCEAYDDRCAVTRLRIINGGGRSEVQAAHIRPVADDGPDIVQNGLALSATAHWLFDRHLISVSDDYRLLVADNRVPSELRGLFREAEDRLHLPRDRTLWPHPRFLSHHRDRFAGKAA